MKRTREGKRHTVIRVKYARRDREIKTKTKNQAEKRADD